MVKNKETQRITIYCICIILILFFSSCSIINTDTKQIHNSQSIALSHSSKLKSWTIQQNKGCTGNFKQTGYLILRFTFHDKYVEKLKATIGKSSTSLPRFQLGNLAVYNHYGNELHLNVAKYIYKKDTMTIRIFNLRPNLNYFIDSIPFEKGSFTVIWNADSLIMSNAYTNYTDFLDSLSNKGIYESMLERPQHKLLKEIGIDSLKYYKTIYPKSVYPKNSNYTEYKNYLDSLVVKGITPALFKKARQKLYQEIGVDFLGYYYRLFNELGLNNPFKGTLFCPCYFCWPNGNERKKGYFIKDILSKGYIPLKVKKIQKMGENWRNKSKK